MTAILPNISFRRTNIEIYETVTCYVKTYESVTVQAKGKQTMLFNYSPSCILNIIQTEGSSILYLLHVIFRWGLRLKADNNNYALCLCFHLLPFYMLYNIIINTLF